MLIFLYWLSTIKSHHRGREAVNNKKCVMRSPLSRVAFSDEGSPSYHSPFHVIAACSDLLILLKKQQRHRKNTDATETTSTRVRRMADLRVTAPAVQRLRFRKSSLPPPPPRLPHHHHHHHHTLSLGMAAIFQAARHQLMKGVSCRTHGQRHGLPPPRPRWPRSVPSLCFRHQYLSALSLDS